jgi:3-phenylpropionate/trans-cinnamate dioxygenase ferredoxin reductase subunit
MTDSVLIVGASVAGIGAANELRRRGFPGKITLVDAQRDLPYDRPPLSKAFLLGQAALSDLQFHGRDHYVQAGIDLALGSAVVWLDTDKRMVFLKSGEQLTADRIIIATGARARPFPAARCSAAIHLLRDLRDADALRAELRRGKRLAVIGGGFIGAEVASSASTLGLDVVIVEAARLPFERVLGDQIAARIAALHSPAGIELLCGATVDYIEDAGSRRRLLLANGRWIEADIVIAGLGALPNVEWLASSGLKLANGIVCDEQGRTSAPGIFAAGDAAAWFNPSTGLCERHEHWTAAREQSRIVAQAIAGDITMSWAAFVPYFWSDLHGVRLQLLGTAEGADQTRIVHEDRERRAFVGEYRNGDVLIGVFGCNAAAKTMRYMPQLSRGLPAMA